MAETLTLLAVVFGSSYAINRARGVMNPAKDALKLTAVLGVAILILAAIVYVSIVSH